MVFRFSNLAAASLRVLPRNRISRTLGQLAGIRPPRFVVNRAIEVYSRAYGVDLSEIEIPEGGFDSFDAFFTRRFREGCRPVDSDPDGVIAPCDGVLQEIGSIQKGSSFCVKGRFYQVSELIADEEKVDLFEGGTFAVIYLHPRDYHRVHAPVDGRIEAVRYIPGTLFPVNEIGFRHIPKLFANNERVVFFQQSQRHGLVLTVMVGAMGVGRISVSFDKEVVTNSGRAGCFRVYNGNGPESRRGSEIGVFHLGSTAIILLPGDDQLTIVKRSNERVRMGEVIARK
ncbi:MAG: phosphatidylserine decarboxylase [Deltaproteobacteria bacterium]|nr:phosphatidylserine decarboxylase [Deltaproteobacteria bacterium]